MPSKLDHLAQARHNREVLQQLQRSGSTFSDWQITVAFYVALHRVDAHLASYREHPKSHEDRIRIIRGMRQFKGAIYNSYRELEDLSRQARYDCVQWDQDDVAYALGLL